MTIRFARPFEIVCCALLTLGSVHAQSYPAEPIHMVVPFAAGGSTDIVGRAVAQKMSELLGQPIVIDHYGGASTMIGAERVAKSPNDGYTLLVGTSTTVATNPHL
jgi:tripartite-type tricarboxylate transporter receptor subunit TctC